MQTTIVRGGRVLDIRAHRADPADILITGDTITEIGAPGLAAPADATAVDASGTLLQPGLINAHTHAHGNLAKGMGDLWTLELLLTAGPWISGGRTQAPRYNALDTVGAWQMAAKDNRFTLTITDQARHGADYLLVYITKQGFDPATQRLGWGNLELVAQTGKLAPAGQYQVAVNAGSRTGRHIVYTIWQASHLDQSYYFCSDVNFSGR